MPKIKRKRVAFVQTKPEDPTFDPFIPDPAPRGQVYNPRFMRWEWADTGEPVPEARVPSGNAAGCIFKDREGRQSEACFQRGRFASVPIEDVPTWYLHNFLESADVKGAFYNAVEKEYRSRPDG